jgi:hypothetical protein
MDYPDYSVGGGENDEFADEIGYSCYKLFEGDTVGRRCKRDLLFYGILYLLFGISLIVISNLEGCFYVINRFYNISKLNFIRSKLLFYCTNICGENWLLFSSTYNYLLYFIYLTN